LYFHVAFSMVGLIGCLFFNFYLSLRYNIPININLDLVLTVIKKGAMYGTSLSLVLYFYFYGHWLKM
jgi:hypothetical protein